MIVVGIVVWVILCGIAYWGWGDWVVSGEGTVSNSQLVVKSKSIRVLIRLTMLTLGPLWILAALVGLVYLFVCWATEGFLEGFLK